MLADDELDALFGVVPDEFTAARDGLVKRLRGAGERDAAKTVAGLRRPKLAAWAVNQLVRADPAAVKGLLEAGAVVRDQQRRLLSGVKAPRLRAASAARRAMIEELVARAGASLERQGVDPHAHLAQITATLEAASADEDAGHQVLAGRLSSPLAPPTGFGDLSGLSLAVSDEDRADPEAGGPPEEAVDQSQDAREQQPPAQGKQQQRRAQQAERRRVQQLARRRRAEEALQKAHAAADGAEAARKRTQAEVQATTREAETAGKAAEEADAVAIAKRREADRLLRTSQQAEARAERTRAALEVAEEKVAAARRKTEEAERAVEQLD